MENDEELSDILNDYKHAVQRKSSKEYEEAEYELLAWRGKAVAAARMESFLAKLREHDIIDQHIILGGLLYQYLLEETNATTATIELKDFTRHRDMLGDLKITVQLKNVAQND